MASFVGTRELISTLAFVAGELGHEVAYVIDGTFHFSLGSGWSLGVRAESAGRISVTPCRMGHPRGSLLCDAQDRGRLAEILRMASESVAVVAV